MSRRRWLVWVLVCGACAAGLAGWASRSRFAPAHAPLPASVALRAPVSAVWTQLPDHEQHALAPLAQRWSELTPDQRQKWQAIATQFGHLSQADQQVMQARMAHWVALSPAQRQHARLNFNSLQNVSKDEKKSRWDAYQALSDDEKKKWSATALGPPKSAAPSPRPTAPDRLIQPAVRSLPPAARPTRAPIDHYTLLPVPMPVTLPAPQVLPDAPLTSDARAKDAAQP